MYHRKWSTRATYAFFGLLFVFGVGLYVRDLLQGREDWLYGLAMIAIAAIAGAALDLSPFWMVRSLREKRRGAAGPHRYRLHDGGVDVASPGVTATLEWTNVTEAYETKDFFFIYLSKGWATLLPKRVIASEQLPHLRDALRAWVGDRAHLLTG
jgi:hypothetical protein